MEHIQIQTTQNVPIEYEIGNIGDRLIAALIDWGVLIGYILLLSIINQYLDMPQSLLMVLLTLPIFLYDLVSEVVLNGQSIGKKLRHLKVVRLDGSHPTLRNYLLRWVLRPIDIGITLGAAAMAAILFGGRGQRLGDLAAGTTVVKLQQRITLEDTVLSEVDEQYTPRYPRVSRLDDPDIEVVKEVLRRLPQLQNPVLKKKLLRKTQDALETKMGMEPATPSVEFLETVVSDYNAVKGS